VAGGRLSEHCWLTDGWISPLHATFAGYGTTKLPLDPFPIPALLVFKLLLQESMFQVHSIDKYRHSTTHADSPHGLSFASPLIDAHLPSLECTDTGRVVIKAGGGANGDWYADG
jgi:hypothetical protein